MKILLLDIETAPNTAYVWGIFKENIPIKRIIETGYVLCFSAKWLGSDEVFFGSVQDGNIYGMLSTIHSLMDEADAIVHYNGNNFDIPTLNREFLIYGFPPPSPARQIDLYRVVKQRFRFVSNKLDFVCRQLGLGEKNETTFELWVDCMKGNTEAWATMENYNVNDVVILENLYQLLKPWIKSHPNHGLFSDTGLVCPSCGGNHFHRRGFAHTHAGKYQRYQCTGCGTWFRARKAEKTNVFIGVA